MNSTSTWLVSTCVRMRQRSSHGALNCWFRGGQDAKDFGFGVNVPKVEGSDALRHFGRANMSYLAPVGNGRPFKRVSSTVQLVTAFGQPRAAILRLSLMPH